MRRGRLLVALIALVAFLGTSACGNRPATEAAFNLVFKYGVGAKNELNTFNGTYTRDMITDSSVTVSLSLSRGDLDRIYQKMLEIDFFNYPDRFSVPVPPGEPTSMVTPNMSYYFKVEYGSQVKELTWADSITNKNVRADKLRELIRLITGIIESKDEYKKLPAPKGGYI